MDVNLFIPCFIDQMFPQTGFNTIKILEKAGCKVKYNPGQTCCGQPAFNSGYQKVVKPIAAKCLNELRANIPIVCPSGSCTGMIKNYYPDLFKNTANHNLCKQVTGNIQELTSFLTDHIKFTDFGASLNATACYHHACGALRECGVKAAPLELLKHVKGLELIETSDSEECCGFGGTFSVKFEPLSIAMAQKKVENAVEAGAEYIISTDSSCLMHLNAYIEKSKIDLKTIHIVDVLAKGW